MMTGAEDNLLTEDEITQTRTALSQVSIPAMRIIMAGVGHSVSDDGLATASDFLKSVLPRVT